MAIYSVILNSNGDQVYMNADILSVDQQSGSVVFSLLAKVEDGQGNTVMVPVFSGSDRQVLGVALSSQIVVAEGDHKEHDHDEEDLT